DRDAASERTGPSALGMKSACATTDELAPPRTRPPTRRLASRERPGTACRTGGRARTTANGSETGERPGHTADRRARVERARRGGCGTPFRTVKSSPSAADSRWPLGDATINGPSGDDNDRDTARGVETEQLGSGAEARGAAWRRGGPWGEAVSQATDLTPPSPETPSLPWGRERMTPSLAPPRPGHLAMEGGGQTRAAAEETKATAGGRVGIEDEDGRGFPEARGTARSTRPSSAETANESTRPGEGRRRYERPPPGAPPSILALRRGRRVDAAGRSDDKSPGARSPRAGAAGGRSPPPVFLSPAPALILRPCAVRPRVLSMGRRKRRECEFVWRTEDERSLGVGDGEVPSLPPPRGPGGRRKPSPTADPRQWQAKLGSSTPAATSAGRCPRARSAFSRDVTVPGVERAKAADMSIQRKY
ncbi:hypothetical protein THAOC_35774, partial [Thalassiosira oceanica]